VRSTPRVQIPVFLRNVRITGVWVRKN